MTTVAKKLINTPPDEYLQLYHLNMGSWGKMQETLLQLWQEGDPDAWVVINSDDSYIRGWGLLFDNWDVSNAFYIYVDQKYRQQGIGGKILERARKITPELEVFPWDIASSNFYKKFGVEVEQQTDAPRYKIKSYRLDKPAPVS